MSPDEFDLFSTYSYLFGNKRVKSKLSISRVFLMGRLATSFETRILIRMCPNAVSSSFPLSLSACSRQPLQEHLPSAFRLPLLVSPLPAPVSPLPALVSPLPAL